MLKILASCCACAALAACDGPSPESGKLIQATPEQRVRSFSQLSTDKQIAVFPELMRRITPRPIALSVNIARGGRQNAFKVANAIVATRDARDKTSLLKILRMMQGLGTYDICEDRDIVKLIVPKQPMEHGGGRWHLQYALDLIDMCLPRPSPSARNRGDI